MDLRSHIKILCNKTQFLRPVHIVKCCPYVILNKVLVGCRICITKYEYRLFYSGFSKLHSRIDTCHCIEVCKIIKSPCKGNSPMSVSVSLDNCQKLHILPYTCLHHLHIVPYIIEVDISLYSVYLIHLLYASKLSAFKNIPYGFYYVPCHKTPYSESFLCLVSCQGMYGNSKGCHVLIVQCVV